VVPHLLFNFGERGMRIVEAELSMMTRYSENLTNQNASHGGTAFRVCPCPSATATGKNAGLVRLTRVRPGDSLF
jgi:hypothetical protein